MRVRSAVLALLSVVLADGPSAATAADVDRTIGTLPPGRSVTVRFRVAITGNPCAVSNQGTVSGNFSDVLTDDPGTGAPADPTTTPVQATPAVGVTSSTNPSVFGQSVTFTATVSAPGGAPCVTPTGLVQFQDNGGPLGLPQPLNGLGVAALTTTTLSVGSHPITALYLGDANYNVQTGTLVGNPQVVNKSDTTTAITSDLPDPSVTGQAVTVQYSVVPSPPGSGTPTGNVTVTVSGGAETCTGTVLSGQCTITLTSASASPRTLIATYAGDASFNGSSGTTAHTVNKADTTILIASDLPDPSVVGQPVMVVYSVSVTAPGAGTPTGTVTVTDGVDSCTGTLPAATSCSITLTTVGSRTLTASYVGDANFNGSTSVGEPHTVGKADTTTTITSDAPDPSSVGQPVLVTYTVVANPPGSGVPSGSVSVTDGTDSCTGTVATPSCTITFTSAGSKTLVATYAGDARFNGSASAGEPHTVAQASTTTAITTDAPDPSVVGQTVLVTYTVTPSGSGTPSGNVTVSDGVTSCTSTVALGNCSLALATAGGRSLTATYAGDANFAGSTSAIEPHTVNKANTTTVITLDPTDPSVTGQTVTVSYAVSVNAPGSGAPTGSVMVTDGTDSCSGTVAAGSCAITFGSAGLRTLTATYLGDTNFNASPASAGEPHTVDKASTTMGIGASPSPSATGQVVNVVFGVGVDAPGSGVPTGNVTVTDGTTSCVAPVAANSCLITFTTPGPRIITATYAGDANFTGTTSPGLPHSVATLGTCAAPVIVVPDGRVTSTAIPLNSTAWFGASLSIGHSYSLEFRNAGGNGQAELSQANAPGTATVFSGDDACGSSSVIARDTTSVEPREPTGAVRLSFLATGTNSFFTARLANGAAVPYTFSLSDTTRFSPAWSTNGTFDTFYAIQNTTGDTVNGTLTLYNLAGTPVTTFAASIPGGAKANAVTVSLGTPRNMTGTARFTHDGPPGAILIEAAIANLTLANPYVQPVRFDAVREAR